MNRGRCGADAVPDRATRVGDGLPQATSASVVNAWVTERLAEMAVLLEAQGGNPYRAAAYRKASAIVSDLAEDLRSLFEREGAGGIDALPAIGSGITSAIVEMLTSGRWNRLERLRGDMDPDALFRTIPGVGARLAQRLHEALGVDSLEALEIAAIDGRLARVPRLGQRRAAAIRAALTQLLDQRRSPRRTRAPNPTAPEPALEGLLDVDREYRAAAQADKLPKIAPRRFNPDGKAWLPVLHTARGDWHFTALYSNTARAHELGRVHDWVVLYADDNDHNERQYTVVTPSGGPLAGRRVVRGREAECQAWYRGQ
jgi:DNA polymerase (family X)